MVLSYLSFDVRMNAEDLRSEREELERKGQTNIYDITAWSIPHALDLDAYWCDLSDTGDMELLSEPALPVGAVLGAPDVHGAHETAWAIDGADDSAVAFAAQAMELGLEVHIADKPFTTANRAFPRGSLLVRRHENDEDGLAQRLHEAATRSGATVYSTTSSRSPDNGPDLGGTHFTLLSRPRIAVLANSPVSRDTFGHLWYALDHELRVPYSLLDATSFNFYDLRRYNVLVLPPAGGSLRSILEANADALSTWISGGGTLIACGSSAAMLTDEDLGLSAVRLRRDSLDDLDSYARAVQRERNARTIEIDEVEVWGDVAKDAAPRVDAEQSAADDAAKSAEHEDAPTAEHDAWQRRFAPAGVFLRGEVNRFEWLTSGIASDALPVPASGSRVFLAKPPVRTAGPRPPRARSGGARPPSGPRRPPGAAASSRPAAPRSR